MSGTGAAGMFRWDTGLAVFLYNMFSDLVKAILRTVRNLTVLNRKHGTAERAYEYYFNLKEYI